MRRSSMLRSSVVVIAVGMMALAPASSGPALAQSLGLRPGPQEYGQGFGKNKVQYRQFQWKIYHSPHFDVYYYTDQDEVLQKVVSFAESAYDRLSREFNFQIQEPTPLIFYETHAAFEQNNIILNFIPEGVGAFATPNRFRMVLPVDLPDPELMELILHELTHIFQYHILFQGSLAKSLRISGPLWFIEGMASFMARDESARDKMFLRDAVVNDRIPPVSRWSGEGFFAYRIGHAVFDFIVERWGWEGFVDFFYEYRNTIGGSVARAVERTFRMDPEEFDAEFRRWLRKKYLPELLKTGEPGDFGRPFRGAESTLGNTTSPTASPSGDLIAALNTGRGDVDVILLDTENRVPLKNLSKGYTGDYQYLVAQELTLGRKMGRDIAFSADGNTIAVFGKREEGRALFLLDVLRNGIRKRFDLPELDQEISPAWSPDGRKIAFSGWKAGQFDIFELDVDTGEVSHVTNDPVYDASPTYSPDGRSLVFSSVVGEGYAKLFRVDRSNPSQRFQLTSGDSNELDAVYSPDGERVYFTSDRNGVENVYGLELASGEIRQHTNAVTGCFMPTVLAEPDGERLVYTALWKGTFQLYVTEVDEPVTEPVVVDLEVEPQQPEELAQFEPDIQVAINDENKEKYGGFKLFLEDADSFIGVDDDQTLIGRVVISFSDYLGDRRLIGIFSSVDSFSNFDVIYANLSRRLQWSLRLFDDRDFFIGIDQRTGRLERGQAFFRQTGAIAAIQYPLSFYIRGEIGAGYVLRELDLQASIVDPETGQEIPVIVPVDDDFPVIEAALVGDSAVYAPWGPVSGRRWRLDAFYAPDLDDSGTLTSSVDLDFRQYVPLTRRTNLAFRVFAGASEGNAPSPIAFGGLDTVRGFRFRELVGTRAFFANAELRFPLIDVLATPIFGFQGIRGVFFLDVGGAWFDEFQDFDVWDNDESRLEDAVAAYGWGFTLRLFGFNVNWDFSKEWDFKDSSTDFRTSFWIGTRF